MGGFFEAISTAISGIGKSILGAFESIGNFMKDSFGKVVDFLSKVPGYINDGFEWVGKQLGSLFNGNTDSVAETVSTASDVTATSSTSGADSLLGNFSPDGITNMTSKGMNVTALAQTHGGANFGSISQGATRASQDGVTQVTSAGTAAASKSVQEGGMSFGKITEFFKTDLGGMVGKAGEAGLTYMAMQQMTKNQEKMQESMARRQEQSNREQWLREEQRRSQMTSWSAQRANEEARAQANNSWSGFTGKWVNPTTEVPVPQA